jgi:GDPmannose 4,6-dehydratase
MKTALITGITGQDGSYLAEFLLDKGYEVHGVVRRTSSLNTWRIDHILPDISLYYGDMTDTSSIASIIKDVYPDEIYNLAAQSQVRTSFICPDSTGDITGLGVTRILESARTIVPHAKIYQASSSEMFGSSSPPQNERTPFNPKSPYACAKLYAHHMVNVYRESYGMYACCGIMFNHESPRRGLDFVTRKITNAIAHIATGHDGKLKLGNLMAVRDWGYAPEYVECMWKMLQQDQPKDYVIGTGESHTVQEFLDYAFEYAGLNPKKYVETDSTLFRPNEVNVLVADASKAKEEIGWTPKIKFKKLVEIMVDVDIARVKRNN